MLRTNVTVILNMVLVLLSLDAVFLQHLKQQRDTVSENETRGGPKDGDIRLVNGTNEFSGRVEVFYERVWGTVCDDRWAAADAAVVCRMLNFTGGIPRTAAHFGQGSGVIWLDNVGCTGDEEHIFDCEAYWPSDCGHNEDAGVVCVSEGSETVDPVDDTTEAMDTDTVQLVNGHDGPWAGRVEVFHEGVWGSVCDDNWDDRDAEVVCRQLGYTGGTGFVDNNFGSGGGTIWLDEVRCSGTESKIEQCPHLRWGLHDCHHFEDAGVRCDAPVDVVDEVTTVSDVASAIPDNEVSVVVTNGDVRLVGGTSASEGRVEIFLHGSWGTICDDDWDQVDALVVCHQLGYRGGEALVDLQFGTGNGRIHFDDVSCTGSEATILECASSEWSVHNCSHLEVAAVNCLN